MRPSFSLGDNATPDPHLLDSRRHLGHGLLQRPGHDRTIEFAGAGQGQQQLRRLGGGGLQHVEAIQQHQADAGQPQDGDG